MLRNAHTTVPGLDPDAARETAEVLQSRLIATLDLQLTLKHVHWNVVGPDFLSVHEMLDDLVEDVRAMSDELAERRRTLGSDPAGTPGAIVGSRSWDDYAVGRGLVATHLNALDRVYDGVIGDHRKAIEATNPLDPVTEDLFIGQTAKLEMQQWFIRSFLEATGTDKWARTDDTTQLADRMPTPEEEAAAERADAPDVSDEYQEMTRIGANVKGEGQIT